MNGAGLSGESAVQAVFYALILLLPLSALVARRIAWRRSLALAAAWIGIFAVAVLAFTLVQSSGASTHAADAPAPAER